MAELYNLGAKVDSDFLGTTGKETLVAEITSPVGKGFFFFWILPLMYHLNG